jgi:CubicO group peptidase (beta-lactamase class C family)
MGFMVLMRLLQDVTGSDFRAWMKSRVLDKLKMTGSTFEMTLPVALARAAVGHDVSGNPIPGLRKRNQHQC